MNFFFNLSLYFRVTSATTMNAHSSRSHAIFTGFSIASANFCLGNHKILNRITDDFLYLLGDHWKPRPLLIFIK